MSNAVVGAPRLPVALLALVGLTSMIPAQFLLPPGYISTPFAPNVVNKPATSLSVDSQGRIYRLLSDGRVHVFEDTTMDGIGDTTTLYWDGRGTVAGACVGLLWFQNRVYVAHVGTVTMLEDTNNDLVADTVNHIVLGLPAGWHQNNDLFTDGTSIFFGLGSVTDHDVDPDPRSATLMRMNPNGTGLSIFATGLRNTFDGIAHPLTNDIFAGDNGPNLVSGNLSPDEEVNWIRQGLDYGHPNSWGFPGPTGSGTGPMMTLPPHVSPCGMAVNPTTLLPGHRNEIVMVLFNNLVGSIVKVPLHYGTQTGIPGLWYEFFAGGFSNPIDVEFDAQGALYVLEYSPCRITRIVPEHASRIVIESQPSIGTTCTLSLESPGFGNHQIFAGASTQLLPGSVPLGPNCDLHIDISSPIWAFSVTPGNGVFNFPSPGLLNANGSATASVVIPPYPSLIGTTLFLQTVTRDPAPGGLFVDSSPPIALTVQQLW